MSSFSCLPCYNIINIITSDGYNEVKKSSARHVPDTEYFTRVDPPSIFTTAIPISKRKEDSHPEDPIAA